MIPADEIRALLRASATGQPGVPLPDVKVPRVLLDEMLAAHTFGREEARKAEEKLRRLATDALAHLAGAGIATPEEGYVKAPHCLSDNIDRLARERDEAAGEKKAAEVAAAMAAKLSRAARLSIVQLLATLDYETGDYVPVCVCTSSGNEEPPGSIDVQCHMCTARKLLGITKQQDTAELATAWAAEEARRMGEEVVP